MQNAQNANSVSKRHAKEKQIGQQNIVDQEKTGGTGELCIQNFCPRATKVRRTGVSQKEFAPDEELNGE